MELYQKSAAQGNPYAQLNLATAYQHGLLGLSQNNTEAVSFYRKAATEGNSEAWRHLGDAFKDGPLGLGKNPALAKEYYQKAMRIQPSSNLHDKLDEFLSLSSDPSGAVTIVKHAPNRPVKVVNLEARICLASVEMA